MTRYDRQLEDYFQVGDIVIVTATTEQLEEEMVHENYYTACYFLYAKIISIFDEEDVVIQFEINNRNEQPLRLLMNKKYLKKVKYID